MPGWLGACPTPCAVCRGWDSQRICSTCSARWTRLLPRCPRCADEVPGAGPDGLRVCGACLRDPPPFHRSIAALDFAFPWDGLVSAFKFHEALDLADALAARLDDAVSRAGPDGADLVLPVPLSAGRLRERGYNQAWELARRVARRQGLPAMPDLLLRLRDTPQQSRLALADRAGNVRGAFCVEPARRSALAGRHVALVDDVMTSGATVAAAAQELLRSGAAAVQVWVLARTPRA